METATSFTKEITDDKEYSGKPEFTDKDKCLLWKLYLGRKEAFSAMNNDVDLIVNQCLSVKRHLQAVEDSNRNLKQEVRTLRSKYEDLLEKNRKDTGIIMRLKDSESYLKEAVKNKNTTTESLLETQIKNKERTLERNLLQDERDKLVFRSQAITNSLRKTNLRHKSLYELILNEKKKYNEKDEQFIEETQQLKYVLGKNDSILEEWLQNNAERDAAIRHLQDDMKEGLRMQLESNAEDAIDETVTSEVDVSSDKEETSQSKEVRPAPVEISKPAKTESRTSQNKEEESREVVYRKEWLSKKTLFEAAEKQKEHFMDFYIILNKRMQDLNTEIVNVREWFLDKQTEKREILEKMSAMEKLVAEKRRQKPIPPRTVTDEIKIWINVQREANAALRKIACKYLSVKVEDFVLYSEFSKIVKNMYVNTLKEYLAMEDGMGKEASKSKEGEEKS